MIGPHSGVPGRRSLTEVLPAAGAETSHHPPVQRTGASSAAINWSYAQETASAGVADAGAALPHHDAIQRAFGHHDVSDIKAQVGGPAQDATAALGASAYAQGDRVAFASSPDLHTAAHEAAHVVQQRAGHAPPGGIDTVDDALEQQADAVADAVVAGESAEELLDELGEPASESASDAAAVQRKANAPPTAAELRRMMERYLTVNSRDVWRSVGEHMRSIQLPAPHPRLTWVNYNAFHVRMLVQLESNIEFTPLAPFEELLYPSTAAKAIVDSLPTTFAWAPAVGISVAHALHTAIAASIKRLAVRYLDVADSKGESGEDVVSVFDIISSMPIDRYIAPALCERRAVTVAPPDDKTAKEKKGKAVGLRPVELTWEGERDQNLWNWVRVTNPFDATAEEVAAKLWVVTDNHGDKNASFNAYLLAAAPPLFGIPKRFAIQNPNAKKYAPPHALAGDDSIEAQLLHLGASKATDDAALHQSPPVGTPAGAPPQLSSVLDAFGDCLRQLTFVKGEVAPWGFSVPVTTAQAFVVRKQNELPTAEAATIVAWAPVAYGQKERLAKIAGAVHNLVEAASKLGINDPKSDQAAPVREIVELLAVAAGISHLAQASEAKLVQALQLQAGLQVRALQATERNMMGAIRDLHQSAGDNKFTSGQSHDAVMLQDRSRALQAQMLNGQAVDEAELEDVSMRSEEVALESRMYATLDALVDLNQAARAARDGLAAHIASLFDGEFRDLPAVTKHIFDKISPVRNNWNGARQAYEEEDRIPNRTPERKAQTRAERRAELTRAQQKFDLIAKEKKLEKFFKNAAELIEDQQFRTAIVRVAALIGISIVAGAVAGVAARAVGGMLMQASGAAAVTELSMAARAGIAITRLGVDATISAAGTAAVQDRNFGEVWKENLIVSLASSAVFGSIGRYAAEQAKLEGRIAATWAKTGKLGKLAIVTKEVGAISAHTIWGAAMGSVAGRIVTGKTQPPPETMREWALQGISVAVGRHVQQRIATRSKAYQKLEQYAEDQGRGLVRAAGKLTALAKQVTSSKKPDLALKLLEEHDQFLRKEIEALDRAIAKTGDPTGELWAQRKNLELAADAASSHGMMDTKMTLIGMEELVPGALWKGTKGQIDQALVSAKKADKNAKLVSTGSKRWRLEVGDRRIEVQEVVSSAKSVDVERVMLAGHDGEMRLAAKLVPPEAGKLDVIVHGTVDDFVVTINGLDLTLNHRTLATYIKKSGIKYKAIRLLACQAGMHPKGAAQHLANKLGVTVWAPTDKLYIHPDGTLTIGPHETRNTGKFEPFAPKKSELRYQKAPEPEPTKATKSTKPATPDDATQISTKALGGDESGAPRKFEWEGKELTVGGKLGSGGEKQVYAVDGRDDIVVGIAKEKVPVDRLVMEATKLNELSDLGLPVVEIRGIIEVHGQPAVVMNRFATGSKDVVRTVDRKVRIVGDSPLLNERSIADLEKIRDVLSTTPVWINDLQFLIGKDGSIVVADVIDFKVGKKPSDSNKDTIKRLIDVARANITKRGSQ